MKATHLRGVRGGILCACLLNKKNKTVAVGQVKAALKAPSNNKNRDITDTRFAHPIMQGLIKLLERRLYTWRKTKDLQQLS